MHLEEMGQGRRQPRRVAGAAGQVRGGREPGMHGQRPILDLAQLMPGEPRHVPAEALVVRPVEPGEQPQQRQAPADVNLDAGQPQEQTRVQNARTRSRQASQPGGAE